VSGDALSLRGRCAIITGASLGLGRAIAEAYVRAGASVLVTARGEDALRETVALLRSARPETRQEVHAMAADVAKPEDCVAVVERALRTLGDVSALVNNAGVYGPVGRLDETSWAEWVDAVQINLFGTILMCRAVLPHFRTRGSGKIVNLSGGGATAPLPRFSAYAASKAAVVRITETLAEEFKAERIDVNAIAPGALNTRLLDQVLDAGPEKAGAQFHQQALKQRDSGGVPLEKGAALAVFLASAASDGISGRLLSAVWDDWAHLPEHRTELADSDVFTLRRIVPKDRGLEW
jgi:3-oxoacyl-[acyl-carrier protein] reductase